MPATLNIPTVPPTPIPLIDAVRVYKRVNGTSFTMLAELPVGVSAWTDPNGMLNDEYYITYLSSTTGVESLPSNVYRVRTHWAQDMGVVLELDTTTAHPNVDLVGVYRRRFGDTISYRLATVPFGTTYYWDESGAPGDEYHTTHIDSVNLYESQPGPSVIADAETGVVVITGFMTSVTGRPADLGPGPRDPLGAAPMVLASLCWMHRFRSPASSGQAVLRTHYEVTVLPTGVWSMPLVPNDLITGVDSYYEFSFSDGTKCFKKIRSLNGAAQNFSLLEDVRPFDIR